MNTMGDLVTRSKYLLRDPQLDTDDPAWLRATVRMQLDDAILHLARRGVWGTVAVMQAVKDRSLYPLEEQSLFLASGRDNGGGTGSETQLTDSTASFVAAGVVVDDVLRNLTDGSKGVVTTVAATVLTCAGGFAGGTANVVDTGDKYIVERLGGLSLVVSIDTVLYNGFELTYGTEETLERRLGKGWETSLSGPKYWTVDNQQTPTVIKVVPSPRLTGSFIPVLPAAPLMMPWEDNLVVFLRDSPQTAVADESDVGIMDAYQDIIVWKAVEALSNNEGEQQELSLSVAAKELSNLWMRQLGIT